MTLIEFYLGMILGAVLTYYVMRNVIQSLEHDVIRSREAQARERHDLVQQSQRIRQYIDAIKEPSRN